MPIEKTNDKLTCYIKPDAKFLSLEMLIKGREHLNTARKSVENNPEYLDRVDLARLPVMYIFLVRWNDLKAQANDELSWPIEVSIDELLEQFIDIAKKNKITHLSEPVQGFEKLRDTVKQQKEEQSN